VSAEACIALGALRPKLEAYPNKDLNLGHLAISRTLPVRDRRLDFVARTPEEIAQARADWEARERFGDVHAYDGPRLSAPSLLRFARPNPAS